MRINTVGELADLIVEAGWTGGAASEAPPRVDDPSELAFIDAFGPQDQPPSPVEGADAGNRDDVPPRRMMFWELVSAFRDFPGVLRKVLSGDRWREPYLAWHDGIKALVAGQDRTALDALVPFELSREVAAGCDLRFLYDPAERLLRAVGRGPVPGSGALEMSAVEVHDRFGGAVIEEVLERGSAYA
jgi:hypothetical protein